MKFASGAAVNAIIPIDPYNPLGLPPFTIRCKFKSGYTPSMGDSQTLVDAEENVWDIYKNSTSWDSLFYYNSKLIAVLGANTTSCTEFRRLFFQCSNLTTVQLFDTSLCTNFSGMFFMCKKLTTFPLFDTSSGYNMADMYGNCIMLKIIPLFSTSTWSSVSNMFYNCKNVESGALALYQQLSTQANPPRQYIDCFKSCGSDTVTGAAELAQIPSDWK